MILICYNGVSLFYRDIDEVMFFNKGKIDN